MSKTKVVEGGWTWYIGKIVEAHPGKVLDYSALMKKYITGVKWEEAM